MKKEVSFTCKKKIDLQYKILKFLMFKAIKEQFFIANNQIKFELKIYQLQISRLQLVVCYIWNLSINFLESK